VITELGREVDRRVDYWFCDY